ncbi:MAG: TrkH family potassium uptake protein [Methanobacteriaceae archaeon]|nr:TrkH family potassium uptake protein [Methanobacteriaceae archaeon]
MGTHSINKLKKKELFALAHFTGYILVILAVMMLAPLIVSLIYNEPHYLNSFIKSALITSAIGLLLYRGFGGGEREDLTSRSSLLFVTYIWFVAAFVVSLPFIFSNDLSFLDALYESMSAITTTGMTMYVDTENLAYSILMWRAICQWLGGIGIIILLLTIVPSSVTLMRLYSAEGRTEQIAPSMKHSAMIFTKIYLGFTGLGFILYLISGMDIFNAICYSFTAISSGGFTNHNSALGWFDSTLVELITMFLMIVGSTNYIIHYYTVKGNFKVAFKDIEVRLMALFLIVGSIIVTFSLMTSHFFGNNLFMACRHGIFQVVSAVTTTGFQTVNIGNWPTISLLILSIFMILGGGACSAAGGIKLYNVAVAFKAIVWEVYAMILPKNTVPVHTITHVKTKIIQDKQVKQISLYVIAYILILFVSILSLSFFYSDLVAVLVNVSSALGNVGLTTSMISAHSPSFVKIVLIIDFWIGRLGVWPVLIFIIYMVEFSKIKV